MTARPKRVQLDASKFPPWDKRLAVEALKATWLARFKDGWRPIDSERVEREAAEELEALVKAHYAGKELS